MNNWHVFLHIFRDEINPWAQIYFISWWLLAAVIIMNIFVALILDNFIAKECWPNSRYYLLYTDVNLRQISRLFFNISLQQ